MMTPDATHDTPPTDAPRAAAFVVTITEAAKLLQCSVRTVQRRLDAGEWEVVMVAGKRCVRLPADALPDGVTPVMPSDMLDSDVINMSPDATRDTTLARQPQEGRGAALIAAIVAETLEQSQARAVTRQRPTVDIADRLLLTIEEAATYAGVGQSALEAAIKAGDIPVLGGLGRGRRIKRSDLESYVEGL